MRRCGRHIALRLDRPSASRLDVVDDTIDTMVRMAEITTMVAPVQCPIQLTITMFDTIDLDRDAVGVDDDTSDCPSASRLDVVDLTPRRRLRQWDPGIVYNAGTSCRLVCCRDAFVDQVLSVDAPTIADMFHYTHPVLSRPTVPNITVSIPSNVPAQHAFRLFPITSSSSLLCSIRQS